MNLESNNISYKLGGSGKLKNIQGALYGAYTTPCYYVFADLVAGQGYANIHRHIEFAKLDRIAHGSPELTHGLLYGEAGLNYEWCNILMQPFLGLDGRYVHEWSFHEHSADSLNLIVNERSIGTGNVYLGAHFRTLCSCIVLNADFIYQYRYGNLGTNLDAAFIDFGDLYDVNGTQFGRNGFLTNISAQGNFEGMFNWYLEFSAEVWDSYSVLSGSLGFNRYW